MVEKLAAPCELICQRSYGLESAVREAFETGWDEAARKVSDPRNVTLSPKLYLERVIKRFHREGWITDASLDYWQKEAIKTDFRVQAYLEGWRKEIAWEAGCFWDDEKDEGPDCFELASEYLEEVFADPLLKQREKFFLDAETAGSSN